MQLTKEKEGYQSELNRMRDEYQDVQQVNYSGTKILRSSWKTR
jgi:hypothetical protein